LWIIFLMCCWIRFSIILLRIFASMFIKEFEGLVFKCHCSQNMFVREIVNHRVKRIERVHC
jgi:hypothetical protein